MVIRGGQIPKHILQNRWKSAGGGNNTTWKHSQLDLVLEQLFNHYRLLLLQEPDIIRTAKNKITPLCLVIELCYSYKTRLVSLQSNHISKHILSLKQQLEKCNLIVKCKEISYLTEKKEIGQWEQNVCSVWMKQNIRNYGDEEKNKALTCCRVTMPKEKEMSFWHTVCVKIAL